MSVCKSFSVKHGYFFVFPIKFIEFLYYFYQGVSHLRQSQRPLRINDHGQTELCADSGFTGQHIHL